MFPGPATDAIASVRVAHIVGVASFLKVDVSRGSAKQQFQGDAKHELGRHRVEIDDRPRGSFAQALNHVPRMSNDDLLLLRQQPRTKCVLHAATRIDPSLAIQGHQPLAQHHLQLFEQRALLEAFGISQHLLH